MGGPARTEEHGEMSYETLKRERELAAAESEVSGWARLVAARESELELEGARVEESQAAVAGARAAQWARVDREPPQYFADTQFHITGDWPEDVALAQAEQAAQDAL